MGNYFLAVDLGASSGRHILGSLQEGRLVLEEVHRFANGCPLVGNQMCWDLDHLVDEVVFGLKKCASMGKTPQSVAIDTWGLDFALLDREGKLAAPAVSHRDHRTDGIYSEIFDIVPRDELYRRTGIQMASFNTLCQLMALRRRQPEVLARAHRLLMIPDYLNYRLTGQARMEYTNATTTQLINLKTGDWDRELIEAMGLPSRLFDPVTKPVSVLGGLSKEMLRQVGYDTQVRLVASHDTASAFLSSPCDSARTICISSGTWSLVGVEIQQPQPTETWEKLNFSCEGGLGVHLLLKNSMGMWLIQRLRAESGMDISYGELCRRAEATETQAVIDCNHQRFLAPISMTGEIQSFCRETGQPVPETLEQLASVVYRSLAVSYGKIVGEIEAVTGREYRNINILGGGAQAGHLNRMIARHTGKSVWAGPVEAAAVGNIAAQMLDAGVFGSLDHAKICIQESFGAEETQKEAAQL